MKFLIIQFHQFGDVVLTTPIPRELKKYRKDAVITFLTFKRNEPMLRYNPYIDEIITIERDEGILQFIKLLLKIRSSRFDVVLDFMDTPRSMYCTMASGAKQKVGYQTSRRSFVYNMKIERSGIYAVHFKLKFLLPFIDNIKLEEFNDKPETFFSTKEEKKINEIFHQWAIKKSDFVITISPTHKRVTRRWPLEYFKEVAKYLADTYSAKIIFTCAPYEREYLSEISDLSENNYKGKFFVIPNLDLAEMITLFSKVTFHFGNDSLPHHLATSQNKPTFIVIGATGPGFCHPSEIHTYASKELHCQPCKKITCKFGNNILPCLKNFHFDEFKDKLDFFINNIVLQK